MTADLTAHGNLMGGVRKATHQHKLKRKAPKGKPKETSSKSSESKTKNDRTNSPGNKYDFIGSGRRPEGDLVDETPVNRGRAIEGDGIQRVRSERVSKLPKAIGSPSAFVPTTGPAQITPPGPTAREAAEAKAASAKKGTKNTSTIKVAQPAIDLEEGPSFGKPVYSITDIPRQWGKK